MADTKRVPTGGTGLDAVASILQMFGQNTKQTSSANTGPLEELIAQLSAPQDPAAQLAGIFQQAAGQIPKFGTAFGNAVGARSGNNGPMAAMLQNLLQQTTLAGQKQIAEQDLQRQNIRGNAAGTLAQVTQRKDTQTSPNYGGAAKTLGALQILGQTGLTDKFRKSFAAGTEAPAATGDLFSAPFSSVFQDPGGYLSASLSGGGDLSSASFDVGSLTSAFDPWQYAGGAGEVATSALDSGGDFLTSAFDSVKSWFGFADGGLVGRDGEMLPDDIPSYADGGIVRSGGGRRSSAPSYTPDTVQTTAAVNTRPGTGRFSMTGGGGEPAGMRDPADFSGLDMSAMSVGQTASLLAPQLNPGTPALGPGVIGTGIPDWAFSLLSLVPGVGPVVPAALKFGNKLLRDMDPLNPSSSRRENEMDRQSDQAAKAGPQQGTPSAPAGGPDRDFMEPIEFGGSSDGGSFDFGGSGSSFDGGFSGDGGFGGGYGSGGSIIQPMLKADGGEVDGPGTEKSDSVPAMLSAGEYIVSADVVDALGVEFFDNLQKQLHSMTEVKKSPDPKHLQTMKK